MDIQSLQVHAGQRSLCHVPCLRVLVVAPVPYIDPFIPLLTHSFSKYIWSSYSVSYTRLDSGKMIVNKTPLNPRRTPVCQETATDRYLRYTVICPLYEQGWEQWWLQNFYLNDNLIRKGRGQRLVLKLYQHCKPIVFTCVSSWGVADRCFLEKMVGKMRHENMSRRQLGRGEGRAFAKYIQFGYLCHITHHLNTQWCKITIFFFFLWS